MLAIRIVTITISALVMILVAAFGFSSSEFLFPIGVILFYTAVLIFLDYSNHKNYKPGLWIALTLAVLPIIGLVTLLCLFSYVGYWD